MQKKVTFYVDANLWEQVNQLVETGDAKSRREFVEQAVRAKLLRIEREKWNHDMVAASKDPLYLADQEEVVRDFQYADAEAARMIDELDEARPDEEPL